MSAWLEVPLVWWCCFSFGRCEQLQSLQERKATEAFGSTNVSLDSRRRCCRCVSLDVLINSLADFGPTEAAQQLPLWLPSHTLDIPIHFFFFSALGLRSEKLSCCFAFSSLLLLGQMNMQQ